MLELSFVTIIHRICLVSKETVEACQPESERIIYATQVQKSLPLLRCCPFNEKRPLQSIEMQSVYFPSV